MKFYFRRKNRKNNKITSETSAFLESEQTPLRLRKIDKIDRKEVTCLSSSMKNNYEPFLVVTLIVVNTDAFMYERSIFCRFFTNLVSPARPK